MFIPFERVVSAPESFAVSSAFFAPMLCLSSPYQ
jgi:hypothetical protein